MKAKARPLQKAPWGTGYLRRKYKAFRRSCRRRNISYSISWEDFKDLSILPCFYCNKPPSTRGKVDNYMPVPMNGIDRVDSNKGYILKNCVTSCTRCNMAKGSMSLEHFLNMVGKIYEKHRHYFDFFQVPNDTGKQLENKTSKKSSRQWNALSRIVYK